MLRGDISEILFSSIKENDSHRASKLLQIERWCYANWRLHAGYGEIRNKFLAQVLSDGECWEEVGGLHEVKLNRQKVGEKLIVLGSDSTPNPFGTARYKIACQCCLEQDIVKMFSDHMQERNVINEDSLKKLVSNLSHGDPLQAFWSHVVGNYALSNNFDCTVDWKQVEAVESFWNKAKSGDYSKLNLKGRHLYEYGLDCAIGWKKVEAVEFFWNKIEALPESEMSKEKKDEILMKNAAYTAGGNFRVYPDVFEFCLGKISPDRYPELLKRDLEKNGHYGSLNRMKDMHNFDKFQKLFDYLEFTKVEEDDYYLWLKFMIEDCREYYLNKSISVFKYMWGKEGFDNHRTFTLNKEMLDDSVFQGRFLVYLVEKNYMEPVWAILDKANTNQIKEFMDSKKHHISGILATRGDSDLLSKFSAHGKSADEGLCQKPDPSGNLIEAKVEETHGQSRIE